LKNSHFPRSAFCVAALLLLCGAVTTAWAHDSVDSQARSVDALLEQSPDDVELLLRRSALRLEEQNYAEALGDAARARELAPDDPAIDFHFGWLLYEAGAFSEALPHLTAFIDETGGSLRAFWLRARILEDAGELSSAAADYEAALRFGDTVDLYLELGRLLSNGSLDQAAAVYRRALERTNATVARVALFDAEVALGRAEAALELVEGGLASSRVQTRWLLRRAVALELAGRLPEARESRLAALTEAERLVERRASCLALADRARAYLALGRHAEAADDLTIARARCADAPVVREVTALAAEVAP